MNELERNLKLADDVLRYLSVLVAPEADAAKLRGEIESRKQKLAESRAAAAAAASSRETAEMGEAAEAEGGEDETSEPAESDGGTESN